MNLSTLLDMAAEAFGERCALVSDGAQYSYAELQRAALNAAADIRRAAPAYVALLDTTSPAGVIALYAAAYAGVPYVPLNYRLTAPELNALIARVSPAYLVTTPQYAQLLDAHPGLVVCERADFLNLPDSDEPASPQGDPASIAVQLFTSGTTGTPKAAVLRHENLSSYILGTVEFASAEEDDALLVTVPPYHIAGISAVLSSTYALRKMVQLDGFEAQAWLAAAEAHGISNAFLVPTMLARLLELIGKDAPGSRLPKLRALAYGGGKMPLPVIEQAMRLLPHVDFTNAYGLTETSSTIAVLTPADHRAAAASNDPLIRRRLSSVGQPGAVEIEIRDDAGRALGPEEAGLVFVRGPQVSGEYLSLGSQLDAQGWFPTKDRGYLDADGYLYLDGRADDVIVRGGENISPGEIEAVLLAHPAVQDAAVVACPDVEWGEGVAAAVVLKAGSSVSAEDLQACVKAALRSSRVPQKIVFKTELPYNELGKILRRVLRAEMAV